MVITVPALFVIQRDQEQVGSQEPLEQERTVVAAGDGIA